MSSGRRPITHADASCAPAPAPGPSGAVRTSGPCDCLPASPDGWPTCATCGLAQRPGKDFCTFCGRRWISEEDARPPSDSARGDRPAP